MFNKFKFMISLAVGMLAMFNVAKATPIDLIEQGSEWNYTTLSTDLWSIWSSVDYNTFDFSSASYNNGHAAFGNASTYTTYWAANTDLALTQSFLMNGTANSDLTLNVASDNGFAIFLNGNQIAKQNHEGFTSYWEYTFSIDSSLLQAGANYIEVLAEDHGGATFFDMKLSGDVTNVPEPSSLIIVAFGLLGLFGRRLAR